MTHATKPSNRFKRSDYGQGYVTTYHIDDAQGQWIRSVSYCDAMRVAQREANRTGDVVLLYGSASDCGLIVEPNEVSE